MPSSPVPLTRRRRPPLPLAMGASLFYGGAGLTLLAMALPHPAHVDERGYLALATAQIVVATALLLRPAARFEGLVVPVVLVAGIAATTAGVLLSGERHGGDPLFNEVLYVWCALYAGYFQRRAVIAPALVLIGAAYGTVLAVIGLDGPVLLTRWLVVVTAVVGMAALAHALRLSVDRLLARLRRQAHTDELTAVLNRRGFQERFGVELARAGRTGEPLALLAGDLDHFKMLNDRFGHGAGDEALAAVGEALRLACRGVDTVGRIGGEEFAVLLPSTAPSAAFDVAERLRHAVSRVSDPSGRPLAISFGVVAFEGPGLGDPDQLLVLADRALYRAKADGRDRTIAHDGGRPVRAVALTA